MGALAQRSALVLGLLFGLVFAAGIGVMWYLDAPMWYALVFAVTITTVQYALAPWLLDRLFTIEWQKPSQVSPEFAAWYEQTCRELKITPPRWGVIADGNPNAFTYGRTRGDARVVVTSGLLHVLDDAELKAVVAHEFGHVAHRDFIVMTVAQTVPLILYIFYTWTRDRARDGGYALAVAVGAYAAYIASQFIMLLLSRVREYFADEQAALATHDPNALSSALVKIAYGLAPRHDKVLAARIAEENASKDKKDKGHKHEPARQGNYGTATATLSIANLNAAPGWAMSASDETGTFSLANMNRAAQWDFKNPWARWFEWNSTHPLTARRIQGLNSVAKKLGQPVRYDVQEDERRYSGNFASEFLLYSLPVIGALVAWIGSRYVLGQPWTHALGLALIAFCTGTLVYLWCAYPRGESRLRTVQSLVGDELDVSHINALPCSIEGEIIGRGVPGLFWSDDLVLRDATGHITIQYRQPLGILEFLWGWLKAGRYQNRRARVYGWYRRAPVPYVEISRVEMLDNPADNVRCHYVWGSVALSLLGIVVGVALNLYF